ncbi:methyltransferase family protein [Sporothrix schenckii 1099-18]|uniref:Methyltransferase family protein n=1 Tax=Sporothrix schenckii 1099-18 TaxID=1397361 RepID=A0A0F2M3E4_SPOSC|nr:methyltransferase family protein [Sporothrix schenckii 1099-18]KJR83629.1 methyltransferase family protein [Sporothrix schenckii 1099-18]
MSSGSQFMKLATAGPGVAPAARMVKRAHELLPFSKATIVVDMGCGPGQITDTVLKDHLSALPPTATLVGADLSAQMLESYNKRKQEEVDSGNAYWSRAQTVQTDVTDCAAFSDGSVSHMLAGFLVFFVPTPEQALQAMKRTLTPGGVLSMSAWTSSHWMDLMYYPKKVRPDLVMPRLPNTWTSVDGVTAQLEKAGFQEIEVLETEGYWPFDDYDEACRFILTKLPLSSRVVGQMTEEEVLKTHELMVRDLKEWYPSVPAKMVGNATVAFARKI